MSKRILVIEDDKDIQTTLQELLECEGYLTEAANNGAVALQLLENAEILPDLILLDYTMPEMDGPAFRARQEKDPRIASIPIVLMTADGHPESKHSQMGTRDFVKKPLDIDRFLAVLSRILN